MIVAGEASGDMHGSEIARRLYAADPDIRCTGMGSHRMAAAGVELLYDSADIAVVGLWEVLKHWPEIRKALHTLQNHVAKHPPDLLVLIDYQEFNLRLARAAKAAGVKVLFYVSPQVWAWRESRLHKFLGHIDMMAVIFPFETAYFERAGIPVRYVGHPLTERVKPELDRVQARRRYGLPEDGPVVALLPGSRGSEIRRLLPVMAETAKRIARQVPETRFVVAAAHARAAGKIREFLTGSGIDAVIAESDTYNAVHSADAAVVASGTATLEVALLEVPMAIVYRVSSISYAILRRLIRIPRVGLANIVAGEEVAAEFIQSAARADLIAAEIVRLLTDSGYRSKRQSALGRVKACLGDIDGLQGITDLALELLHGPVPAAPQARTGRR